MINGLTGHGDTGVPADTEGDTVPTTPAGTIAPASGATARGRLGRGALVGTKPPTAGEDRERVTREDRVTGPEGGG
jgi:hypothetical protein